MASPQQEIFTECRKIAISVVGESSTYEYLPPTGTSYPFVYIGEQFSQDRINKSAVFGTVTQSIHIYHSDWQKRGTTSKIIDDILKKARAVKSTASYYVSITGVSQRILPDNSTGQFLIHGVLELTFLFNFKGVKN